MKTKNIKVTINLPMQFPKEYSDGDIWFWLNESSWCASNVIELLQKYEQEVGCLCHICEFEVLPESDDDHPQD